jgi:hypothetical protein
LTTDAGISADVIAVITGFEPAATGRQIEAHDRVAAAGSGAGVGTSVGVVGVTVVADFTFFDSTVAVTTYRAQQAKTAIADQASDAISGARAGFSAPIDRRQDIGTSSQ